MWLSPSTERAVPFHWNFCFGISTGGADCGTASGGGNSFMVEVLATVLERLGRGTGIGLGLLSDICWPRGWWAEGAAFLLAGRATVVLM
jgi:Na+-transporting NADH:ubiquinone oxidoreductase subunit NqrD